MFTQPENVETTSLPVNDYVNTSDPYGISARIVNFTDLYLTAGSNAIVVNRFDLSRQEQIDLLSSLVYTHYEGDALNSVPICDCKKTFGRGNEDIRCPECGTLVLSVTERPLQSILWIEPPQGVTTLINPEVWFILNKQLTHRGVRLLEWLCNPTMQLPPEPPAAARKLQSLEIERGLNNFHDKFDEIMELLFDNGLVTGTREQKNDLQEFIAVYRDAIFAPALPIPSKLGFITERTVNRTYADPRMMPAIDAIHTISGTENSPTPLSLKQRQARAVKAIDLLSSYYQDFIGETLGKKTGLARKHVYGSRLHCTFRAVISSLSENHHYEELHLPWSAAVMVYKYHLISLLRNMGPEWTPRACMKLLDEYTLTHHPLIEDLFNRLIQGSRYTLPNIDPLDNSPPRRGMPVLLNRNPTLMRGSIQRFYVTKIKPGLDLTNPSPDQNVNSISMSVLCLTAFNADFDGKALPSLNLSNCWKPSKAA